MRSPSTDDADPDPPNRHHDEAAPVRVLLIEDNRVDARFVGGGLAKTRTLRFDVVHVETLAAGLTRAAQADIDVALLDLNLPDGEGLSNVDRLLVAADGVPVIVLTSRDDEQLAIEALRLGAQDYLIKGEVTPHLLARAIRYALERRHAAEALRRSEGQYRLLFDANPHPMWVYDRDTLAFLAVNDAAVVHYGYSREEFLTQSITEIHLSEDLPELLATLAQRGGVIRKPGVWRHRTKDGTVIDVEITTHDLVFAGRPGRQVLAHDVTDRQRAQAEIQRLTAQLEQRVRERTAQLQASNKELAAFAYSMAHDLRAPLRGIDGFSHALLEEYGTTLAPQAQEYLARVRAASQRMGVLIDDLLQLSRITRAPMNCKQVDLAALARSIATELQRAQPERQGTFVIGEAIGGYGDPPLLRVLLEHLLGNAWKYTSKHPAARIEFGTTKIGAGRSPTVDWTPGMAQEQSTIAQLQSETVYFVHDDGAGFDMAYANKLFRAFQRLHGVKEFEGSGVGLATVQRIVQRHGGNVWAEGAVEQGATFYFTLPEQLPVA